MNDHNARTLSTIAIWIATACTYIFGVFRFNWNGALPGLLWAAIALAIASAAATATAAIWRRQTSGADESQSPQRLETSGEVAPR